jgi:hypothetical protein
VKQAADQILDHDQYFDKLHRVLKQYNLVAPVKRLLSRKIRFSRVSDEEMTKLELLGLAKGNQELWVARNPLLERGLIDWTQSMTEETNLRDFSRNLPEHETKIYYGDQYTTIINKSSDIDIGKNNQSQHDSR